MKVGCIFKNADMNMSIVLHLLAPIRYLNSPHKTSYTQQ